MFWRMDDSGVINLQEWYRRTIYTVRIAVDRCFLRSGWSENVMLSTTARGYLNNEVNGCQGRTNAMERGALGGECNLELRGSAVF